jgi:hypothetical protein
MPDGGPAPTVVGQLAPEQVAMGMAHCSRRSIGSAARRIEQAGIDERVMTRSARVLTFRRIL